MDDNENRTSKLRRTSKVIVILTGLLWAVYDVIPAINAGRGDTISENVRDWSRKWWILPYVWGALTAHFFVNIGQPDAYKTLFQILAMLTFGLFAANVCTALFLGEAPAWSRAVALMVGFASGLALWAQNH